MERSEILKKIRETENIVVLTGVGDSTDSGIPDFRGHLGIYMERQLI